VILGAFLVAFYGFSYPLKITGFTENLTFIMSLMVMPIFFGVLILMRLIKTKKKDIFLFSLVFSPILWLLLRLITTFLLIESDSFEVTISNSLFLLVILAFIRQHHSGRNRQGNISAPSFYEKFSITPREKEIILLLKEGMSYREIQQELDISFGTVKTHISNIYEKAGVNSRITLLNLLAAYESPEEQ
jgi:DNA-binding CsgD family transcriptional regulator